MPLETHDFDEVYEADPQSVARARSDTARFAMSVGASPTQVHNVRLAVSEAATNSVLHGYRDARGDIRIAAGVSDQSLWIVVADSGCGMQIRTDRPGLGLGLGLIAEITDHMTIVPRPEGGTELLMRFDLDTRVHTASGGGDVTTTMLAFAAPSEA